MEKIRFFFFLFMLIVPSIVSAQMMRMSPEERANRLKDSLSLSADQTKKVLAIFQDDQKKMQELFQNNQGDRESRRAVMGKMRDSTDTKIEALLTPEQIKRYEDMKKNRPQHGFGH